ncbi:zinc-dependent alcohol dehydrogenase [Paenibacillus sp. CAU 1782]
MNNDKIVFTASWQVELKQEQLDPASLQPGFALVRKRFTLISPGTELACLSGGEAWFGMPGTPGYAAVSEVVEIGPNDNDIKPGDFVFHYGQHSRYEIVPVSGVFLKIPPELDLRMAPFCRMVTVAMTAIRVSAIELGDRVAVTGMGLIGNMAAQLSGLQGARVIGVDLSERRLALAKECGVEYTLHAGSGDLTGSIKKLSGGVGVSTFIEATGVPQAAVNGLPWIAPFGELIFLGSPRGEFQTNVTDVFNYSHLVGRGCITFKGAHEWRYPLTPNAFVKHSLVRNTEIAFDLIASGKLQIEPLISHTLKPETAALAYDGLRHRKDEFNGVLFDWA